MKRLLTTLAMLCSVANAAVVITPSVKAEITDVVTPVTKQGVLEFHLPDLTGQTVTSAILDISLTGAARPFTSNAVTELYIHGYAADGVAMIGDRTSGSPVAGPFRASWYVTSPNLPDLSSVDITSFVADLASRGESFIGLRFELVPITPYPLELRFSVGESPGSAGTRDPRIFIETTPVPEPSLSCLVVLAMSAAMGRRRRIEE